MEAEPTKITKTFIFMNDLIFSDDEFETRGQDEQTTIKEKITQIEQLIIKLINKFLKDYGTCNLVSYDLWTTILPEVQLRMPDLHTMLTKLPVGVTLQATTEDRKSVTDTKKGGDDDLPSVDDLQAWGTPMINKYLEQSKEWQDVDAGNRTLIIIGSNVAELDAKTFKCCVKKVVEMSDELSCDETIQQLSYIHDEFKKIVTFKGNKIYKITRESPCGYLEEVLESDDDDEGDDFQYAEDDDDLGAVSDDPDTIKDPRPSLEPKRRSLSGLRKSTKHRTHRHANSSVS